MKKTNITIILASLVLSGCGSVDSNSNSSVSTNSSINISTSSSIDKTNWIKNGTEEDAISNSNEWVYNNDDNSIRESMEDFKAGFDAMKQELADTRAELSKYINQQQSADNADNSNNVDNNEGGADNAS
mgnify:CR=1 FL=1